MKKLFLALLIVFSPQWSDACVSIGGTKTICGRSQVNTAGIVFAPTDISSLAFMWDSDKSTITTGSGTDLVESVSNIASPTEYTLTYPSSEFQGDQKRPQLVANQLNGKPIIRFDSEKRLKVTTTTPLYVAGRPFTFYVLIKPLVGADHGSVRDWFFLPPGIRISRSDAYYFRNIYFNIGTSTGGQMQAGGLIPFGTSWKKLVFKYNGGAVNARDSFTALFDGIEQPIQMSPYNQYSNSLGFTVGMNSGYANFDLAHASWFNSTLSNVESEMMEQYLQKEWGILATPSIQYAWTPADDAAGVWHDFDDVRNITYDYTDGVDTATIKTIKNKGDGNNATYADAKNYFNLWQATKSGQPPIVGNYQNKRSVARFDGTNYIFNASGLTGSGPYYLNQIFSSDKTVQNGGGVWDDWTWIWYVKVDPVVNAALFNDYNSIPNLVVQNTNRLVFNFPAAGDGSTQCSEITASTAFKYVLAHHHRNSATSATTALYINGVLQETKTSATESGYRTNAAIIFANSGLGQRWKGWVGEHAFFRNRTAAQLLTKGRTYGQVKWGTP